MSRGFVFCFCQVFWGGRVSRNDGGGTLVKGERKCPREGAALLRGVSNWLGARFAALQKACSS